jgi:hypothetical protein
MWVITHNGPLATKQHRVELQITILSSERVVLVVGIVKHRSMW